MCDVRFERAEASHLDRHLNPLVERAKNDGLPAAPGETRDTEPGAVHLRERDEIIQPSTHRQVKQAQFVRTHKVQVCAEVVRVLRQSELATTHPFQAEGHNAALGEIDAALLLVLGGFPQRVVSVDVKDRRCLSRNMFRLVKDRRRVEPRHDFVPKLVPPIALPDFNLSEILKLRRRINPLAWPPTKGDVIQNMLSPPLSLGGPLLSRSR
jgi:hypothetical protein